MSREHEEKQLEMEAQHSANTEKLQRDWAQRWAERERQFADEQKLKGEQRRKELDDMRTEYKRLLAESATRMEEETKERDRRDIALLQEKLDQLNETRQIMDRDRQQYEQTAAEKYEIALKRAKEQIKPLGKKPRLCVVVK